MYWVICQDTSAHCYHNSERGLSQVYVDGLTLHWNKDFVGCVLMNVLRMKSIFLCVCRLYQNERFYCIIVLVSCIRNLLV